MVLIKSISGVRGTIHEEGNRGLSNSEIIHCINQFSFWLKTLRFYLGIREYFHQKNYLDYLI